MKERSISMGSDLVNKTEKDFESIKHIDENGVEFWYARELMTMLEYSKWGNFKNVINKAKEACKGSNIAEEEHFADVGRVLKVGNNAEMEVDDFKLTRYACYLIAQNGDPQKQEIAFAQTYFAVQTRKQEVIEQRLSDINRLQLREQLKTAEKRLSQNIYERGVDERGFGRIRSKGDQALFGGYTTDDMKRRYGIKYGPLADRLPPVTIAAKGLATEMTNLNIEENNLQGEEPITQEHVQNNQSVRSMLQERGITPEELPPDEDIKKVERRVKADEKKLMGKSGKLPVDE